MSANLNEDWRLTNQKEYLYKKKLTKKKYEQPSETWDHDHCEFCWERIDVNSPAAYTDEDDYHWICEECYNDFKEMFEWEVE